MKYFLVLATIITSIHASADMADSDKTGWLVGGGVGNADLSLNYRVEDGSTSKTKNTPLITAFGGYNFTHWFGLEFDASVSEKFTDETTNLNASIKGLSGSAKFMHHFNESLGLYFKLGHQYIAYEQERKSFYDDEATLNDIDHFLGAGVQFSFSSGVRARIDYKHAKFRLERSENNIYYIYDFNFYDETIDLTVDAITLSVHYQF